MKDIIQFLGSVIVVMGYLGVFSFLCWIIVDCINSKTTTHKEKKGITILAVLATVAAVLMALYAIPVFKAVLT